MSQIIPAPRRLLFVGGPWHGRVEPVPYGYNDRVVVPLPSPGAPTIVDNAIVYHAQRCLLGEMWGSELIGYRGTVMVIGHPARIDVIDALLCATGVDTWESHLGEPFTPTDPEGHAS